MRPEIISAAQTRNRGQHRRHPRNRDEKKQIPSHDTGGPVEEELEPKIVEDVPDPEGDHEMGPALTAILPGDDPDRRQHHQSGDFPADLYEKTPLMLYPQCSNLLDCKDGEGEPTIGDRIVEGPKVLHHSGLDERERDGPQNDRGNQSHLIPFYLGTSTSSRLSRWLVR